MELDEMANAASDQPSEEENEDNGSTPWGSQLESNMRMSGIG